MNIKETGASARFMRAWLCFSLILFWLGLIQVFECSIFSVELEIITYVLLIFV